MYYVSAHQHGWNVQLPNNPTLSVSQKRADMLNLRLSEVNVTGLHGDQQYQCVLEKIESNAIICRIKGEPEPVPAVDTLIVSVHIHVLYKLS